MRHFYCVNLFLTGVFLGENSRTALRITRKTDQQWMCVCLGVFKGDSSLSTIPWTQVEDWRNDLCARLVRSLEWSDTLFGLYSRERSLWYSFNRGLLGPQRRCTDVVLNTKISPPSSLPVVMQLSRTWTYRLIVFSFLFLVKYIKYHKHSVDSIVL